LKTFSIITVEHTVICILPPIRDTAKVVPYVEPPRDKVLGESLIVGSPVFDSVISHVNGFGAALFDLVRRRCWYGGSG
jgi:hypothetical protein